MARPMWFVNVLKKLFPSRYTLARLTRIPGVGNELDYGLFNGDEIIYLPKDNSIQINAPIERPGDIVLPSQAVDHFIERSKSHWIMDSCICRESDHCNDYPREDGCIFLGEAVHQINPELGRLVTKDEALEHANRCREAGLVHMIGRSKLDSVWLGANPSHKLFTICNCCPCCCIWKMIPYLNTSISSKITKMPGTTVTVTEQCQGCGICTENTCFAGAISMNDYIAVIGDSCRGCGRCIEVCPDNAIQLTIEDDTFIQKTVTRLSPLVDIT